MDGPDGLDGIDAGANGAGGLDCDLSHDGTGLGLHGCDYGDISGIGTDGAGCFMSAMGIGAAPDQAMQEFGVRTNEAGMVFGIHVRQHGMLDLKAALAKVAIKLGMVRVHPHWVCIPALDKTEPKILPLSAWSRFAKAGAMPADHYFGATGSTVLFRQHLQIGRRRWWWWSKPEVDKALFARVDVVAIQWAYRETGDYETMMQWRVVPKLCPVRKIVPACVPTVDRHVRATKRTVKLMEARFQKALPQEASRQLRASKTATQRLSQPTQPTRRPVVLAGSGADIASALVRPAAATRRPTLTEVGEQVRLAAIVATTVPVRPQPRPVRVLVELPVAVDTVIV